MLCASAIALGAIAWFNYRVDPARLFDDGHYVAEAARHMAAGRNVVAANLDERLLQRHYAGSSKTMPRVVVFGSSRIMEVDSSMIAAKSLYNAGLSTATLPDLLALGGLFVRGASKPDLIVIGVDPWLLNRTPRNDRWQTLGREYRAMTLQIGGLTPRDSPGSVWAKLGSLISIAYLERSLARFDGGIEQLFGKRNSRVRTVKTRLGAVAIRRADGSLGYDAAFRSRSPTDIHVAALNHGAKHVTDILKWPPLDPKSERVFDRYIGWLRGQGVKVALVMTPFHPAHYRHVMAKDKSGSLRRIEAALRALSRKYGLTVLGTFDPGAAGCTEDEFWDGMHAKEACLRKVLRGLKAS